MCKIEKRQTKTKARETRPKKIRKTHFLRKEIQTQKKSYIEGQEIFF